MHNTDEECVGVIVSDKKCMCECVCLNEGAHKCILACTLPEYFMYTNVSCKKIY